MESENNVKYDDATDEKWKVCDVPLLVATEKTFEDYGRLVNDLESEEIFFAQWPYTGSRKMIPGTGINTSVISGENEHHWIGDRLWSNNKATTWGAFCCGRLPADVSATKRTHVLTREANYHPDGGQCWYPAAGEAFVMLLALPTDDIKPEHFRAFYFDGSCGLQIKPGVWHQPPFQIDDEASIKGKQGSVFACVAVDTVEEFNTFLRIPLDPQLAA